MPLDHYVTLGRSGLRVSPFCLGAMTFGEDWGLGLDGRRVRGDHGALLRARRQFHRHRQRLHRRPFGADHRRLHRATIAPAATRSSSRPSSSATCRGAPERRRRRPQGRRRLVRAVAAAAADRLHRPLLDARVGPLHARSRRRCGRSTIWCAPGKVRYIGFSDTPAWKVAQAQITAHFRGWTPLVALQIEYSLLERTVEGELMPMARELGLGVTPWSPLAGGVLSGKYPREDAATLKSDRGARALSRLTERTFAILDEVDRAWPRRSTHDARGGGAGLGAVAAGRRLDDHRRAPARSARRQSGARWSCGCRRRTSQALDAVSAPVLNFPAGVPERSANRSCTTG